jgi:hypothetical protein
MAPWGCFYGELYRLLPLFMSLKAI